MPEQIKVFVAGSCEPCQEIKKMVEEGRFDQGEVDMIDLETEEGYPYLEKMGLKRVPAAYLGPKECKLSIDDEKKMLVIDCGETPTAG